MKTFIFLITILMAVGFNCSNAQDTWTQKADFGGTGRFWATGFSIGSKGYIGTGYDQNNHIKKDFWEYNPSTDSWSQKADFGGAPRDQAVGFSIDGKGYIGTGISDTYSFLKDFWEYDAAANSWDQKADFGGTARYAAVGFSIGSRGFIGTGFDGVAFPNVTKDFWEYIPATDTWIQINPLPAAKRSGAVGFSIGNKGYVGTGYDNMTNYLKDFWEYDPVAIAWMQKADFAGTARFYDVGFSIGSKGYIGTGYDGNGSKKDFWEYDTTLNQWFQKSDLAGVERNSGVGFSIGNKGYVGTGVQTFLGLKDFWEYTPDNYCNPPAILQLSALSSYSAKLSWFAVSGVVGYKFRYKVSGADNWIVTSSVDTVELIQGLSPETEYVWQVKSICGVNPIISSEWSAKQFFTTFPLRITEEDGSSGIQSSALSIYPNPFTSSTTISFSLNENSYTTLELFDLEGRKIKTLLDENTDAGDRALWTDRHNVQFNRDQLCAGIYVLAMKNKGQIVVKKIVLE
jgi:N-acetylneuraminic acid mutarotase